MFALKNILVLLAKHDSGELRCPATALIKFEVPLLHSKQVPLLHNTVSVSMLLKSTTRVRDVAEFGNTEL